MQSFVIEGGRPLNGNVRAAGNKNGALPILAACLLTEAPVQLTPSNQAAPTTSMRAEHTAVPGAMPS